MQTLLSWLLDLLLWGVVYLMWRYERPVITAFDTAWGLKPGQYSHNKMFWRVFYFGLAVIALVFLGFCLEQTTK